MLLPAPVQVYDCCQVLGVVLELSWRHCDRLAHQITQAAEKALTQL
jgi:hypothetical protein